MKARDKRIIATATFAEEDLDERSTLDRVLDNYSDVSDDEGWMWIAPGDDDDFTFEIQKDRYTIRVTLDPETNSIESAEMRVAIRSDIELLRAMREM